MVVASGAIAVGAELVARVLAKRKRVRTPQDDGQYLMAPQQRYLNTVRDGVRAALKARRTITQAMAEVGAGERGKWELFDDFHAHNVTVAFTELEWED